MFLLFCIGAYWFRYTPTRINSVLQNKYIVYKAAQIEQNAYDSAYRAAIFMGDNMEQAMFKAIDAKNKISGTTLVPDSNLTVRGYQLAPDMKSIVALMGTDRVVFTIGKCTKADPTCIVL